MTRHAAKLAGLMVIVICSASLVAADLKPLQLPAPRKDGGRPLMQVLQDRHSAREFSTNPLTTQMLSDLLWAAFGVSRPDGRRTAPSASNVQEIDVYVALADGLFVYEPGSHSLAGVTAEDVRAGTGTQEFVGTAPVNLVYVADMKKSKAANPDDRLSYTGADAGFIAENVYLFCASEGLATVVRASVDRATLARRMHLRPDQRIVLAQSVGYPKK